MNIARLKHEGDQIVTRAKEETLKSKIDGLKETIKKSARKGNMHELDDIKIELESSIKAREENINPEKRYKTNDATVEKLACLLKENPNGLLLLRDELYGWLKGLNKSGREGDREFYLEAWNGYGSFTVDRVMRGTLHVPALCLSVFGGLQPGKLESYVSQTLSGGKGDDGLLQRFQILVYPEMPKKWKNIDRRPDLVAYQQAENIFVKLGNIQISALGVEQIHSVPGIRFDADAQLLFNEWREDLEGRLRSDEIGSPAFESHLAKYRSLVPAMALIFHLLRWASLSPSESSQSSGVGSESFKLALAWSRHLEAHARKVYASALQPELQAAHALLNKIKQGLVRDQDRLRTIYRRNWALLDGSEKVDAALAVLEEHGWVKVES